MTKRKPRLVVTGDDILKAICMEFDNAYGVMGDLVKESEADRTLTIFNDTGFDILWKHGIIPVGTKRYDLDVINPYLTFSKIKKHILSKLRHDDFLVNLTLEDSSDEYWNFQYSFSIKTVLLNISLPDNDTDDDDFLMNS